MAGKQSRRTLKKALRRREAGLNDAIVSFVHGFDFSIKPDLALPETPGAKRQFLLLRRLRGFVCDFLWFRIRTDSRWIGKRPYLDFFQVETVKVDDGEIELVGDIVWWPNCVTQPENWWPRDHVVHPKATYKRVIRGDKRSGGRFVVEPVKASFKVSKNSKRNAEYRIEFGFGSTYFRVSNVRSANRG